MSRDEMLLRAGFYCSTAERLLGDDSYTRRYRGHCEELTEVTYLEMVAEIQARLVSTGALSADDDPFEEMLAK